MGPSWINMQCRSCTGKKYVGSRWALPQPALAELQTSYRRAQRWPLCSGSRTITLALCTSVPSTGNPGSDHIILYSSFDQKGFGWLVMGLFEKRMLSSCLILFDFVLVSMFILCVPQIPNPAIALLRIMFDMKDKKNPGEILRNYKQGESKILLKLITS